MNCKLVSNSFITCKAWVGFGSFHEIFEKRFFLHLWSIRLTFHQRNQRPQPIFPSYWRLRVLWSSKIQRFCSPEAKGRFLVEPQKNYPQAGLDWLSFLKTYIFRNCMMPDTKVWATPILGPCHSQSEYGSSEPLKSAKILLNLNEKWLNSSIS